MDSIGYPPGQLPAATLKWSFQKEKQAPLHPFLDSILDRRMYNQKVHMGRWD